MRRRAASRRWSPSSSPAARAGCVVWTSAPPALRRPSGRGRPRRQQRSRRGAAAPPDDDGGVEIEVTPAGKSTRRLSLLSGGEKSLVALAFVFAVLMARPCPFYILDEVEAALDDINIDRFLRLVRRFAERSQFIVVTHQKRTMDAADILYGVSMGGDGITKVVSRKLPRDELETLPGGPEAATRQPKPLSLLRLASVRPDHDSDQPLLREGSLGPGSHGRQVSRAGAPPAHPLDRRAKSRGWEDRPGAGVRRSGAGRIGRHR